MALWRDGVKFLATGSSGLQYEATLHCALPKGQAQMAVLEFLQSRRCALQSKEEAPAMLLTRGSRLLGRFSWLFPLPETWTFQTIKVTVIEGTESTIVRLVYDAWIFFALIVPPNQLEREAAALRVRLLASVASPT